MIKNIVFAGLFVILAIVIIAISKTFWGGIVFLIPVCIFAVRAILFYKKQKPIIERITYLKGEIDKLNVALQRSVAEI